MNDEMSQLCRIHMSRESTSTFRANERMFRWMLLVSVESVQASTGCGTTTSFAVISCASPAVPAVLFEGYVCVLPLLDKKKTITRQRSTTPMTQAFRRVVRSEQQSLTGDSLSFRPKV